MKTILSFMVVVFIGFLILFSCSKHGGLDNEEDENTPYLVLDLTVATVTDSSVTLRWTATGDDADQGTATTYDIRYYKYQISPSNWDSATQVTGEPLPKPGGETDSMVIGGLMTDSTYYFALNVSDEAGNWSGISNCVMAVCFNNFVVSFPDSNLEAVIRTAISMPTGDIYRADLLNLTFIDANEHNITDLTGLEYCINLAVIFMSWNNIFDLEPISHLRHLTEVQFVVNDISALPDLSDWINLQRLFLSGNNLSNIAPLQDLPSIHHMYLGGNQISDLSPLVANPGLAGGDSVWVDNNPLSDESLNIQIPALEARGVFVYH
jgi:hypothetical protein